MPRQLALFLTAVQFLTRVPVPPLKAFQPDWTARSARFFPLVGAVVGLISAAVFVGASQIWTGWLPALLAVAVGVLVTGAFHEDGLADTADGLGGGQTPSRRLEIMKDSRIGTYGALALILTVAAKVGALQPMSPWFAGLALVAAHAGGRAVAVLAMRLSPYAGDRAATKVKPVADGVTWPEVAAAMMFAAAATAPLVVFAPWPAVGGLAGGVLGASVVVVLARRLIGGWVGDTLGAAEQAFEIGFLLAVAALLAR
ncbi:adenosylcobinamide-GDP ribazoletransferase [Brevundimonas sp.]|uniref:adenosylcobinamide-GDP ribazoletransferase n=1 Tax=Brevundimonas sp. TaxID=1871086 RepID=UPI0037BE4498